MQFACALLRIFISRSEPRLGPVNLSNIDVADVFYRIWILAEDIPKLGVLFPAGVGEDPMVPPPGATNGMETVASHPNDGHRYSGGLDIPALD
jgi:hypothetical protein